MIFPLVNGNVENMFEYLIVTGIVQMYIQCINTRPLKSLLKLYWLTAQTLNFLLCISIGKLMVVE